MAETIYHFENQPNQELYTFCKQIQDKIDNTDDFDETFEDIEKMLVNALGMYMNYWQPQVNFEQKRMNDDIDKTEFVKQTRLLYKTMYNNFGNAELMDEIQTMIKEEPDNDVNEYLNFVECLHSIENYQESDIDNPASIFTDKIKLIKDYLIKKATEAKELREAMDALSNSLGNLSNALDINTNTNSN